MYNAFAALKYQSVTQDSTALAAAVVSRETTKNYMMLPDIISKEPRGPLVRDGDPAWLNVVR